MSHEATQEYDFIVVGGGTAGSAVAGRLAENPSVSILLIEAGPADAKHIPEIMTPGRAFELRGSNYDWQYKTTLIDRPEYTRVEKPNTRGKVLGGSSCTHYHTWVRGSKATYDDWVEYGGQTWDYAHCEKYFSKPATYHDDEGYADPSLSRIGSGGPIHISPGSLVPELEPFRQRLTKAWVSKGQKVTGDVYGGEVNGLFKAVNSTYNGQRSSGWMFVDGKSNVNVLDRTHSKKIHFDGNVATGVTVIRDGKDITFKAKREVIVSSGVFESPKLLMLSGIGPEDVLSEHNIKPIVKSPNVGQNVLDHPILSHVFRVQDGYGLDNILLRAGPMYKAAAEQYQKSKKGPLGSTLLEMIGFPRIDERLEMSAEYREAKKKNGDKDPFGPGGQPHFEIDYVPMFADAFQWHYPTPPTGEYITIIVDLLRPLSRNGVIKLQSTDPLVQPYINLNYFSNTLDLVALREGVRFVDDVLMNGEGFSEIIREEYPFAMPRQSDEAMNKAIMERCQTGYHPCGSCRLGKDISQGVVDPELIVHGTKNLRVIDASVFPVIPDCRIQNAVYMVAEKGADIIKAAHPDLY
ncbi:CAZyme family AA3 [Paecilomyces variotii]|nr:CAZyme family AA3 [Paecilomyces variotii]KAJ9284808.1 CAZyme family AA3 [Paecilomyces variotii]KAJ9350408.1 CAZyme family AA3 [Paecilomyces variotii]